MKIVTGQPMLGEVIELAATSVRFVAEDGQTMFEVSAGKDGISIDIRAPDNCVVGGKLYANNLAIIPHVANKVTVKVPPYDEG